jgi:nicotinamidase-related amidase
MPVIPALPYNYEFPIKGVALVAIDMQRDFMEPGGFGASLGNDVSVLRSVIAPVQHLFKVFRDHQLPIIHTLEAHPSDLSNCPPSKLKRGNSILKIGDRGPMGRILIQGEAGNAIIPELAPEAGEIVIHKPGKGAFYNTPLDSELKKQGITHLIFTGVTTEVCVQTTMREANDRGYECLLVEEGTASYFPEFKQSTLEMIRAQGGIVGWTAHVEDVVNAFAPASVEP